MNDKELKPCPFCGREAVLVDIPQVIFGQKTGQTVYYVRCSRCGASGEKVPTGKVINRPEPITAEMAKAQAKEKWNTRAF